MFRTSTPVTAAAFFDRTSELATLRQAVERLRDGSPQWIALLGSRKVGKTSLLLELMRTEHREDTAFVVLDTFEDGPPSAELFRRLALRVVDAFFSREVGASLESLSVNPDEYKATLIESASFAKLPRELRTAILGAPEASAERRLAEVALGLGERLAVALGRYCVVAWDEFQELARLRLRSEGDVLSLARAIWQKHQRTAYFVCGSERTMLRDLVTREHSPFFQHFSLMEVGSMEEAPALSMLTTAAPPDRPIPKPLARKAFQVFGGHPFYLQMFGETLTAKQPPYDEAVVRQVFSELLFSRTGRLSLHFFNEHERLVGRATTLAAALEALADGPLKLSEIASRIGAATGSTVRYLERLGDAVVRAEDGRYGLTDPVFGLWLRWRKPGGTVVPMAVVGDEAELEVARRFATMGFELVYQSRASRGAFDLLGIRDGLQLGVQVKRTALPLRFSKPEWQRLGKDAERLGWRFVLAVVPPSGGGVVFLDPAAARIAKAVSLDERARIDNLLAWLG